VEQQPSAYEVGGRPPDDNHKLTEQDEPYEIYVAVTDATVNYCLCEKRQY
jgi:hypothetical protein